MSILCFQIKASDVDFTGIAFNTMKLKHKKKMYPPRVTMTVIMKNPSSTLTLPIRFIGCSSGHQLDVELILPLGKVVYM